MCDVHAGPVCRVESEAYTVSDRSVKVAVCGAVYVIDFEELEDVVNAYGELNIRFARHDIASLRELEKNLVVGILRKERVVLVCELAVHASYADVLAPFQ